MRREEPKNYFIAGGLGYAEAGLGNKVAALREGERARALRPASEEEGLAAIEALVGEPDRALARSDGLLTTPYGPFPLNQASLRLDTRSGTSALVSRFKAFVEGPEPTYR